MKSKRGVSGLIMTAVILILILVFLAIGVKDGVAGGLANLWPFVGEENHFPVSKHCEFLCTERNATMFCTDVDARPLPLSLGDKREIQGSCAALSDIGLAGFDSIPKCPHFDCSGYTAAVCKKGRSEVPCSQFG